MTAGESRPLRVGYVGPEWGTCLARLNALRTLEPHVASLDTDQFERSGTLFDTLDRRLTFIGAKYRELNASVLAFCEKERPEIIWFDKAWLIWPSTLETLRSRGIFLVQHNTDMLAPREWSSSATFRLMRKGLHLFHMYFTTNDVDFAALKEKGVPPVEFTHLGYDHERFNADPLPESIRKEWARELLFVGHYEPRTERYILAALDAGLPLTVYGPGWHKTRPTERLKRGVQFRRLNDQEYDWALKAAKIAICFVSEWNANQTAGRSFEIPASGTFLLAMKTRQHLECYKEGEEAVFFDTPEELVTKARYYLEHDDQRTAIARAGHRRCVTSDYSWARFMRDDWAKVRARYAEFRGHTQAIPSPRESANGRALVGPLPGGEGNGGVALRAIE